MRWTRRYQRAVSARTTDADADGEVVWSWRPDAGAKLCGYDPRDDGGNKARSPARARRTPLKPLRREGRMFGQTCGNCRQLFYLLAGHGCGLHPAFPAPSHFWRDTSIPRARWRRENADSHPPWFFDIQIWKRSHVVPDERVGTDEPPPRRPLTCRRSATGLSDKRATYSHSIVPGGFEVTS